MSGRLTILFQYRKRYSPVQRHVSRVKTRELRFQYRKRYSPVQLINIKSSSMRIVFQYRKRYSPVQRGQPGHLRTALRVSIPQAVFACATRLKDSYALGCGFQYRKRYSPVQRRKGAMFFTPTCFNTASGIRLCNRTQPVEILAFDGVSIPQAVFACATEEQ